MADASLTLHALQSDGSFVDYTIKGLINPDVAITKQLPVGNQAEYKYTLYTSDNVYEGDRVTDDFGKLYTVHHTKPYSILNNFQFYQVELFELKEVTLRSRSSTEVYTDSDIYMNLSVAGQSQFTAKQYYSVNDYVAVSSSTVYEGDQVYADGKYYTVMNVTEYPSKRVDFTFVWYVSVLTPRFPTATLQTLALGTADTYTGVPASSYTNTTIYLQIQPKNQSRQTGLFGYISQYDYVGLTDTATSIYEGDRVYYNGNYYTVTFVHTYPCTRTDYTMNWTVLALVKKQFEEAPTTSGTWHSEADATKTDPRYRTKLFIDTYIAATKKDNGVTNASTIRMLDVISFPVSRLLTDLGKDYDVVDVISRVNSKPIMHAGARSPFCYDETVRINIYAVNKTGITGSRILEEHEQAIRDAYNDYPSGSGYIREIEQVSKENVDLGHNILYCLALEVRYRRWNDDYTPTYPSFNYGVGFTYEGDRTSGGIEGTWTLVQGGGSTCAQSITSDKNLLLSQTVFAADSYTYNGTDLGLSTATYPKLRVRFKTTGSAKARVDVTYSDASTGTLMSETASVGTFTVVECALAATKTLDHINLYICDATGTVTYDYVQVYTGTYTIPNVEQATQSLALKDSVLKVPGMSGNLTQNFGSDLLEVRFIHDLDMERASVTWKRPQSTTPKTDYNNTDMLDETLHEMGVSTDWVWLDLGVPAKQFKARLVEVNPDYQGDRHKVESVWREYRHGHANDETLSERYGLSL